MLVKNRKGMTAMVDAMIFIVILGIVIGVVCSLDDDGDPGQEEAFTISDQIFSAKVRISDVLDDDDSRIVTMTDLLAASMLIGDGRAAEYIADVMNDLSKRPESYLMHLKYGDEETVIGEGRGIPLSGYSGELTVSYGGTLSFELRMF